MIKCIFRTLGHLLGPFLILVNLQQSKFNRNPLICLGGSENPLGVGGLLVNHMFQGGSDHPNITLIFVPSYILIFNIYIFGCPWCTSLHYQPHSFYGSYDCTHPKESKLQKSVYRFFNRHSP